VIDGGAGVSVSSRVHESFLQLGRYEEGVLDFEVDLQGWDGHIGLFFGLGQEDDFERTPWYQNVWIARGLWKQESGELQVFYVLQIHTQHGNSGKVMAHAEIAPPVNVDTKLRVRVEDGELKSVWFAGEERTDLMAQYREHVDPALMQGQILDGYGPYGFYCSNAIAEFRRPTVNGKPLLLRDARLATTAQ
jgi:hypothetical protein